MTRTALSPTQSARSTRANPQPEESKIYVVKSGDNMWDIAKKHNVSLDDLMKANPRIRERGGMIYSGTEVKIPSVGAAEARTQAPGARQENAARATPRAPVSPQVQREARARAAANEQNARQNTLGATPASNARMVASASPAPQRSEPQPSDIRAPVDVRATRNMSEAQKYDFYQTLVESKGGEFHRGKRARNIIGLRTETNPNANGGRGAEDDRFVMAWVDRDGNKRVREYQGTTEGNDRNRRTYSGDVNRDGRNDLGRIPNGYYEYGVSKSARLGDVLRPTQAFQVERDFNQDGRYTGRERQADTSGAFLFHKGGSAGCQTMDTANWNRFWSDLHSTGRPQKIGYTLLNL